MTSDPTKPLCVCGQPESRHGSTSPGFSRIDHAYQFSGNYSSPPAETGRDAQSPEEFAFRNAKGIGDLPYSVRRTIYELMESYANYRASLPSPAPQDADDLLREALMALAALVVSGECTDAESALCTEIKTAVLKSHDAILEYLEAASPAQPVGRDTELEKK